MNIYTKVWIHVHKIFWGFKGFLLALDLTSPSLFPCCCLISVSTAARAGRGIQLKNRDFAFLENPLTAWGQKSPRAACVLSREQLVGNVDCGGTSESRS